MGYKVLSVMDNMRDNYGPRKGLEGPFLYPNGRVLYYSTADGEYWDPRTDFFVPADEISTLQDSVFDVIRK
jgi:hypothetical protein